MGRHKSIDRDQVLDHAEKIITERGASALTIAAVAQAAGITKGGVQSCFTTKETMIRALLERWLAEEQKRFQEALHGSSNEVDRVAVHAEITESSDIANERAAGLLIALLQSPQYLDTVRRWYACRMEDLDDSGTAGRNRRLAFLAVEGVFFLRYFGLHSVSDSQWKTSFDDIRWLLKNG